MSERKRFTIEDVNRFAAPLADAGCCITSAGVIAVDTQLLIFRYLEALEELEGVKRELASR